MHRAVASWIIPHGEFVLVIAQWLATQEAWVVSGRLLFGSDG
jgi:hypothetical protein